jgi:hypothetical protein
MTGNRVDGIEHCERAIAIAAEKLGKVGVDLHWMRAIAFHPQMRGKPAENKDVAHFLD